MQGSVASRLRPELVRKADPPRSQADPPQEGVAARGGDAGSRLVEKVETGEKHARLGRAYICPMKGWLRKAGAIPGHCYIVGKGVDTVIDIYVAFKSAEQLAILGDAKQAKSHRRSMASRGRPLARAHPCYKQVFITHAVTTPTSLR